MVAHTSLLPNLANLAKYVLFLGAITVGYDWFPEATQKTIEFFLPNLANLAKYVLLLGAITVVYGWCSEATQKEIDDKIASIVNIHTVSLTIGFYILVTILLYGFFQFGTYVMPYASLLFAYTLSFTIALSLSGENGCLAPIVNLIFVAILAGLMWLLTAIIPTTVIIWCFWPYSQFARIINHIDYDVLRLMVPMATGTDITAQFAASNMIIYNYLESWNTWPWWLFTKPPLNWLFTVYVQNFTPSLVITEIMLQLSFFIALLLLMRLVVYAILFCLFGAAEAVKKWAPGARGMRRVPILGGLLMLIGAALEFALR